VKQSAGYVWCRSEPGRGSTFTVYLPRVEVAEGEAVAERFPERIDSCDLSPEPGVSVLLVDDDKAVRVATARALKRAGYSVLEAASAAEALSACERHGTTDGKSEGDAIRLVVTDLSMPEVSGRELADRLRHRYPALPVLFMSGYTEEAALCEELLPPTAQFIKKPFSLDVFVKTIHSAVSESRARHVGLSSRLHGQSA
jgi:two-component system cell cycle sensor histidine kinase/response regulator CckA